MILERFSALTFIGDALAGRIYRALDVLLREDLEYGGIREWDMGEEDKERCRCGGVFGLRSTETLGDAEMGLEECARFGVRGSDEVMGVEGEGGGGGGGGGRYICQRESIPSELQCGIRLRWMNICR